MKVISPAAGTYIIGVSGGVDSMALLDVLRQDRNLKLIVAHANHGMRGDSHEDEQLVRDYAHKHNLIFESAQLALAPNASEAAARYARYNFLRQCRDKYNATAIITAHHQDDVIETAIIAMMRGTGWRGLAPLKSTVGMLRPLLDVTKNELIGYARKHKLVWHEDSTNENEAYLRNFVRRTLVPRLDQRSENWREVFLRQVRTQQKYREEIESGLRNLLEITSDEALKSESAISRHMIIMLPASVATELLQELFLRHCGKTLTRPQVKRALLFCKVAKIGKTMPLDAMWQLRVKSNRLIVERHPAVVS